MKISVFAVRDKPITRRSDPITLLAYQTFIKFLIQDLNAGIVHSVIVVDHYSLCTSKREKQGSPM